MERLLSTIKQNKKLIAVLWVLSAVFILAIYAPLVASPYPFIAVYEGKLSFPHVSSLFNSSIYTKSIDLFFNALMFTMPLFVWAILKKQRKYLALVLVIQLAMFFVAKSQTFIGSNYHSHRAIAQVVQNPSNPFKLSFAITPPIPFHWEDNALLCEKNSQVRASGQSLYATLFFALRSSISLALLTIAFTYTIGTVLGSVVGYIGGKVDLIFCRILEVFESLPTLLVLLLLVSLKGQSGLFFVSLSLALFSWTSVARVARLEILKQKALPYVDTLKNLEVPVYKILFKHLVPNLYWMLLALLPNALFGIITYESALSFLGLGDPSRASIGLLIDEARRAYPMDPNLFWPPAILLMVLLVLLTWLGDEMRLSLDPRLEKNAL